ncbi:mannitol dehydrogenase family protein [Saccharibacillus sp. CPCC 101409]|uniref:mannitol dehydrogenase family protein n=1 Tax=Saccharibacillus sp. CPCC 101409 TaxID=3058041 RepID=UPI002672045E|nr:mannitol dehydrogenase family protein [Saccharibacillus sp. CPCC 101409]MDO3410127.1 mannitol dehydrogenase family protein [Saccharibacillus sp. CPCC 101409]
MLELSERGLEDREAWERTGVELPGFDRRRMIAETRERPVWVHFGAGNIFRALVAKAQQKLLNAGLARSGIIAAGTPDSETIDLVYRPHDNLTLLVETSAGGGLRKEVIASVAQAVCADPDRADDYAVLTNAFENPSLQLVTFTITEKGYALTGPGGEYPPEAAADLESGPERPAHAMGIAASLAYRRYLAGAYPLAFVSLDNCPHNGDVLRSAMLAVAREWERRGLVRSGFADYLADKDKISFPLTMIDKITPRPSPAIREELERLGIGGMEGSATSRNTYAAPFVNAEIGEYLVIEDRFPAGRPPLEAGGILLADRDTVNRTDTMKVTACLNPLHTALAVTGCLLGYTRIADEMRDPLLRRLAETIGRGEGLPVVTDPGIIRPETFLEEVLSERLPNPYIPDTPQRIASDTSQKIGIRYGQTIRSYMERDGMDPAELTAIPLAIAAWCRYLLGIDDEGRPFEPSPDPLLEHLQARLLGDAYERRTERPDAANALADRARTADPRAILSDTDLFGVDLYASGLGAKIEKLFRDMLDGPGAVRRTLERELGTPQTPGLQGSGRRE